MSEHFVTLCLEQRELRVAEGWMTEPLRVLVIGCGGTGSEVVDALVRLHFVLRNLGHPGLNVTLQDGDTVSPFNIGRQRFAPSDIGQNKAAVLADRYALAFGVDIPYVPLRAVKRHITQFDQFALVVTCVDRASFRVQMADYWRNRRAQTLWMDAGNGDMSGQLVAGHLGIPGGARLPNVLDLFPGIRTTPDDAEPSCSMEAAIRSQMLFINRWMADAAAALLVRLFTTGCVKEHGAFIDMRRMTMVPLRIDPDAWAFLQAGDAVPVPARAGTQAKRRRNASATALRSSRR